MIKSEVYTNRGEKLMGVPSAVNEDRYVSAHNTFAVIDGATDVKGMSINNMTPGAFIADYVHRTLTSLAQQPDYIESEAKLLLAGINRAFGENLEKYHPHVLEEGYPMGPMASAAFARLHHDNSVSYATVGDCYFVMIKKDGTSSVCSPREKPAHLEKEVVDYFQDIFKREKTPLSELLKDKKGRDMMLATRLENNKTWAVINGDPNMEALMESGRENLDNIAALVLMSDGMLAPDLPEPEGAKAAAKQMLEHGLSVYGKKIEDMYNQDPERTAHPRLKHRDDMTAMTLIFDQIKTN